MAKCRVEGCLRLVHGHDLCTVHYHRLRRHGDVGPAEIRLRHTSRPACSVDGCEGPAVGHGYCHTHWKRWRKYQDPRADVPVRPYVRKD